MKRLASSAWALVGAGFVALWLPVAPAVADSGHDAGNSSGHSSGSTSGAQQGHSDSADHSAGDKSKRTTGAKASDGKVAKAKSDKSTSATRSTQTTQTAQTTQAAATDSSTTKTVGSSASGDASGAVNHKSTATTKTRSAQTPAAALKAAVGALAAKPVSTAAAQPVLVQPDAQLVTKAVDTLSAAAKSLADNMTAAVNSVVQQIAAATPKVVTAAAISPQTPATTTTTTQAPLINVVGSFVFNVIGAAIEAFAGAPVVPAGSTVTVKVSSLTMPDTGQTVQADWYFPENADSSTRIIYFQHGFMAVAPMYSYTLATLAEETDSIVVAPTLSSNAFDVNAQWLGGSADQQAVADLFAGDRSALTASARAAGFTGTLPTAFVLAGHSLGGALVTAAAGDMVDNGAIADLQGVVLMDSVDLNNVVPTALAKLTGANYRPVYDISSEPYVWNIDGLVGQELEAARPDQFNGVMLVGGRHIDALQGANPILQFSEYLVAGFSQPQNIDAEQELAVGWINDMFSGVNPSNGTGIYGLPQQTIEILTAAGTATAVVLPFASTTEVQATPWDGVAQVVLDSVLQDAVYTPLDSMSSASTELV
ncbi:alpha/beta fold hydrolase [Mycobacterium sp. OTB74]|jgi:hypothetical protein|uniref:alpha/beta fold hydrolase n=1 Tax=Mycobacterium sp. OTB74 TaxID=1853452 RepID=UPI0024757B4C|nr:alpha/beta fold hydrolase [Mycobacterium sp. OTB74]MDH6245645.1 hypothetical protein [Mycobacterium sp. OTB74]